jgi:hypothetical protein
MTTANTSAATQANATRVGVASVPEFVTVVAIARQMGVSAEVLCSMAMRGEFARIYLFGTRRFFRLDEVSEAIKTKVPGSPEQYRRTVAAADALCSRPAARRRRAARGLARGSSDRASGGRNAP